VTLKVISDPVAAYNTVQTGGADAMVAPSQEIFDQAKAAGMTIEPYTYGVVSFRSFYQFNLQRPPFNDILARQAVYAALDPKKVAAAIGQPTADALYDHDNFYYSKSGTFPKFDAKKAQDLINQWSAKNGGKPLEFTIPQIPGVYSLGGNAEAIQAALAGYQNLKVSVQQVTSAALPALGTSGSFDLYPNAMGGSDPDIPIHGIFLTGAGRNYMKYSNPEMDAAINGGRATADPAKRKPFYDTVQKVMMKDLPVWIMPTKVFVTSAYMIVSNKALENYNSGAWMGMRTSQIWLGKKK
jgi:peptide/nickel transport system substrate-binding protein